MLPFLPYGRQWISESDILCVKEVLESDWLTGGPKIEEFEKHLTKHFGAEYAVVCSSGTAALHLSCLAIGLKPGDSHFTSAITFIASANCGVYCGSIPDFIDINMETFNMSIEDLERKLECAKKRNATPKVLIPVHFAGLPCDMKAIQMLAVKYKCKIIEDGCHAMGASFMGEMVGSCKYSDMVVFSLHPVKHITTGEGGVILTNDKHLYKKLLMLRNHGITRDVETFINRDMAFSDINEPNQWYYEIQELGLNYRLTDFQAALGISQLKRLDEFVCKRRELAAHYNKMLSSLGLKLQNEKQGFKNSYHLYVVMVSFNKLRINRTELIKVLKNKYISAQVHYIPVYLQPFYKNSFGFYKGYCKNAELYYSQAVSLPIFPIMDITDVEYVVKSLHECL